MGACEFGACCKDNVCLPAPYNKKCCCTAAKGSFRAGEVCRMVACYLPGQCLEVELCYCANNGGTFAQSCDPCANVTCNPLACEHCVNGVCVSFCTDQCSPCTFNGITGVCQPITCPQCQSCIGGTCVPYGDPCGADCCDDGECCNPDTNTCVPAACDPPCGACKTCVCGTCVPTGECVTDDDCEVNEKCVSCQCEPKQCGDYSETWTVTCYCGLACGTVISSAPGIQVFDGRCYCAGSAAYEIVVLGCPPGCVRDLAQYTPWDTEACVASGLKCCESRAVYKCKANALP